MVLNIVASSQVTATPSCCLSTSFVSSEVQPLFASDSKGTILGFCISYSEISELNFAGSSGSGKTTEVGASWSCSEIQNGLAPALSPPSGLHRVPRLVRRSRRTARRRTALRRARSPHLQLLHLGWQPREHASGQKGQLGQSHTPPGTESTVPRSSSLPLCSLAPSSPAAAVDVGLPPRSDTGTRTRGKERPSHRLRLLVPLLREKPPPRRHI
jgi:hypothetical protein